jgi:hypothetical protein
MESNGDSARTCRAALRLIVDCWAGTRAGALKDDSKMSRGKGIVDTNENKTRKAGDAGDEDSRHCRRSRETAEGEVGPTPAPSELGLGESKCVLNEATPRCSQPPFTTAQCGAPQCLYPIVESLSPRKDAYSRVLCRYGFKVLR